MQTERLIYTYVGSRLRERRIELGLTQRALGSRIRASRQQVRRYEKGIKRIGAGMLWKIADALCVEPDYFLGGTEVVRPSGVREIAGYLSPEVRAALQLYIEPESLELLTAYSAIARREVRDGIREMVMSLAGKGKPETLQ